MILLDLLDLLVLFKYLGKLLINSDILKLLKMKMEYITFIIMLNRFKRILLTGLNRAIW